MTRYVLIDWAWGFMMTGVGMAVVFGLLGVLWLLLRLIGSLDAAALKRSALAEAPQPDEAEQAEVGTGPAVTMASTDGLDTDTLAAIAVAVVKHADIRRKQGAPEMRTNAPGSQLWASRWVAVGRGLQNTSWRRN